MTTEGILIRKGIVDDLDFIVESQVRMALESEGMELKAEVVRAGVSHVLANPGLGFYLIALDDGKQVACLMILKEWSDWRNGEVWWIHSLYVLPEERRKSVFTRMYRWLEEVVMSQQNLNGLRLYVDKRNLAAIEAYRRLGMDSEHYVLFEWLK